MVSAYGSLKTKAKFTWFPLKVSVSADGNVKIGRLSQFACGFPSCAHVHQCHGCSSLARIKVVASITLNHLESLTS